MSGKPRRIANIQSYVNRADVRSYGGVKKSGNGLHALSFIIIFVFHLKIKKSFCI